jgi:hypothetical protein
MMLVAHPLDAPWLAWNYFGTKRQAIRLWLKILHPAYINGIWYKPWCGWKKFWFARPWRKIK